MLGMRLYLAAGDDELTELERRRPYAAEIHLPPYRPWQEGNSFHDCMTAGVVVMAAPHNGRIGLLLTSSLSYPVPSIPGSAGVPDDSLPHGVDTIIERQSRLAWNDIRADCRHLALPAGFELDEVERGSTECLRAAEASLSRWKLLRKMGPRAFYDDGYDGQVLDATWMFALGFFNLMCPDDGRAQDLHGIFYE